MLRLILMINRNIITIPIPDDSVAAPTRAATMSDVARHAGVSNAAASAVLSGTRSNARVSEATRRRVQQAALDLHYTRNEVARALRRQRTDIIGLYLWHQDLDTRGPFLAEIVGGLQRGCDRHQKDLLVHGTFRGESIEDIFNRLVSGKIDGLILFAEPGDPLVDRLAAAALPVVTVADVVPPLPGVTVDDAGGSRLLAQYLAERGHRRVLYRRGPITHSSTARRYAAFREAAETLALTVLEDPGRAFAADSVFSEYETAALKASAVERPSAIICWNDDLADVTLGCCEKLGLRVPSDIAILGFDGLTSRMRPSRRLTTVRAPWSEVASTAVDLLIQRMGGAAIPAETIMPIEFVVGETA